MADNPQKKVTYRGVMVQPDPFVREFAKQTADASAFYLDAATATKYPPRELYPAAKMGRDVSVPTVARPAGIAIKPNTYATARIIDGGGTVINVLNDVGSPRQSSPVSGTAPGLAGAQLDKAWTDWILVSVHEERTEKTQIVETFGDTYVYAFGERPRVMSFSGALFNSVDFPWRAVFWENWDNYFRATKLIERNARMYITFDDVMVEGYPLNATADQFAQEPHMLNFRFNFLVTNYVNLSANDGFKQARLQTAAGKGQRVSNTLNANRVPYGYGQLEGGASLQSREMATAWLGQYGVDQLMVKAEAGLASELESTFLSSGYAALLSSNLKTMMNTIETAVYSGLHGQPLGKGLDAMSVNAGLSIAASQTAFFRQLGMTKLDDVLGLQSGESQAALGFAIEMGTRIAEMVSPNDPTHPSPPTAAATAAQFVLAAAGYGFWPSYESMNVQQGGQAAIPMAPPGMAWDRVNGRVARAGAPTP